MCNGETGDLVIEERPSPNHTERRGGAVPALIVLHYTGMETVGAAVARLRDPGAEVSAHYLVAEDGRIIRMVADTLRAWHAGVSFWGGERDVNSWSLGIEIANGGPIHGFPPYPEAQFRSVERLVGALRRRWAIPCAGVVGHACVAPGRKIDPGVKFDWRRLALGGSGVWLDPPASARSGSPDADAFRAAARRFGYGVDQASGWSDCLLDVWAAFAGRFLVSSRLSVEEPSAEGVAHMQALAARWPAALDQARPTA